MEPSRPQSGPAGPALPGHLPQGCPAITSTVFPLRAVSAGWGEGSQASPCGQFCTPSEGLTREKAWYGFRNRSQGFCQLLRTDVESEKNKTKGLHSQPNTVTGRFLKGEGGLMTRNLRARAVALNVLLFTAVGSIGWLQSFLHFSEIHQAGSMPSHIQQAHSLVGKRSVFLVGVAAHLNGRWHLQGLPEQPAPSPEPQVCSGAGTCPSWDT